MPRTGRGGKVQGAQGVSYSNRTDLNASVPIAAAPDQTYGEAAQQKAAQRAIPIAPQPAPSPAPGQPSGAPSAVPAGVVAQLSRPAPVVPGSLPFLHPSNRPDEPITAGMDYGAGPGSEVMTPGPPTVADTFGQMAAGPQTSPLMSALASAARTLGV